MEHSLFSIFLPVPLVSLTLGEEFRETAKPGFGNTALIQCSHLTKTDAGKGK